jgi:hypothetical protein
MAVIFRGLRSKLPVTMRTVGFGWGTTGTGGTLAASYSATLGCRGRRDVLPGATATPARPAKQLGKTGDGGCSVVSLEVIELVHQSCAHGSS